MVYISYTIWYSQWSFSLVLDILCFVNHGERRVKSVNDLYFLNSLIFHHKSLGIDLGESLVSLPCLPHRNYDVFVNCCRLDPWANFPFSLLGLWSDYGPGFLRFQLINVTSQVRTYSLAIEGIIQYKSSLKLLMIRILEVGYHLVLYPQLLYLGAIYISKTFYSQ